MGVTTGKIYDDEIQEKGQGIHNLDDKGGSEKLSVNFLCHGCITHKRRSFYFSVNSIAQGGIE